MSKTVAHERIAMSKSAEEKRDVWLFWLGTAAIAVGVVCHLPDFIAARAMGYRMAGMPMSLLMLCGMVLIFAGLPAACLGLMPRRRDLARSSTHAIVWDAGARLTHRHWLLIAAIAIALVLDTMKPALLGFVVPGASKEYGLTRRVVVWLPLVALTGTALGSVVWGGLADLIGRRASILLAAIVFIGTSICGAMPTFAWNVVMCFIMGLGVGGMLPIALTLVAETTPPRHRGWLLVFLGGAGVFGGYLAASASAALLEPSFGWRILWFIGLPTGVLLVALNRLIPESPSFLIQVGRLPQAEAVAARFGGRLVTSGGRAAEGSPPKQPRGAGSILAITLASLVLGLVNSGLLLWLPSELRAAGASVRLADNLLVTSSLLTLPTAAAAAWAYGRWGGLLPLLVFLSELACALVALALLGRWTPGDETLFVALIVAILIGNGGATAVLLPFAIESHGAKVRGRAAGMAAGGGKAGGILAQVATLAGVSLTGGMLVPPAVVALAALLWGPSLRRLKTRVASLPVRPTPSARGSAVAAGDNR